MIRPFKKKDKQHLIEIFNLNVPRYFDPEEANEFIKYLEIKADTYFTIEHERQIIGGVGYEVRENDKSGRINWIFLHPAFTGNGHGKMAVNYCMNILKSDPEVEVLIVRTSQLAYKFFEKSGYKLTCTEKDYWGRGLDLYLMEQKLNRNAGN